MAAPGPNRAAACRPSDQTERTSKMHILSFDAIRNETRIFARHIARAPQAFRLAFAILLVRLGAPQPWRRSG